MSEAYEYSISFLEEYFNAGVPEERADYVGFLKVLHSLDVPVFRYLVVVTVEKFNTLPLTIEELEDLKKLLPPFECLVWSDTPKENGRPKLPFSYLSVVPSLLEKATAEECAAIFLILDSNLIHNDFEDHIWDLVMDEEGNFSTKGSKKDKYKDLLDDDDSKKDFEEHERPIERPTKKSLLKRSCTLF